MIYVRASRKQIPNLSNSKRTKNDYIHPSHRPNRLNSTRVHFRTGRTSSWSFVRPLTLSFAFPFSGNLGGDAEDGVLGIEPAGADSRRLDSALLALSRMGDKDEEASAAGDEGVARRYHPPEYVKATNWYSVAGFSGRFRDGVGFDFPVGEVGSVAITMGTSIHPTVHFSSSAASGSGGAPAAAVKEMCFEDDGRR